MVWWFVFGFLLFWGFFASFTSLILHLHSANGSNWLLVQLLWFSKLYIEHSLLNLVIWDIALSSVQFSCSVVSDSATPWTAACQVSLSITSSWSLPKLMSIESMMPSNHLILCCPLILLPCLILILFDYFYRLIRFFQISISVNLKMRSLKSCPFIGLV